MITIQSGSPVPDFDDWDDGSAAVMGAGIGDSWDVKESGIGLLDGGACVLVFDSTVLADGGGGGVCGGGGGGGWVTGGGVPGLVGGWGGTGSADEAGDGVSGVVGSVTILHLFETNNRLGLKQSPVQILHCCAGLLHFAPKK